MVPQQVSGKHILEPMSPADVSLLKGLAGLELQAGPGLSWGLGHPLWSSGSERLCVQCCSVLTAVECCGVPGGFAALSGLVPGTTRLSPVRWLLWASTGLPCTAAPLQVCEVSV